MAKHCEGCPFKDMPAIGTKGPSDSEVVIVGDAPGTSDILHGEPFNGATGKLLRTFFDRAKWSEGLDSAYITNSIRCIPPKGTPIPTTAIEACRPRLEREIAKAPRKVVMAMGATATKSLLNNYKAKITQLRGQVFHDKGYPVVPMLHPLSILRNPNDTDKLQRDIRTSHEVYTEGKRVKNPGSTEYRVLRDESEIKDALEVLKTVGYIAADIETTGINPRIDQIISLAISWEKNKVVIIEEPFLRKGGLVANFMQSTGAGPRWVWQNGKFDVAFFEARGITVPLHEDTEVMHYVLSPIQGTHGLKDMSREYLGAVTYNDEINNVLKALKAQAKKEKWVREPNYGDIPKEILYPYQAQDADYTLQLFHIFHPQIEAVNRKKFLYRRILMPSSRFLRVVERDGMYVSVERLRAFQKHHARQLEFAIESLQKIVASYWDGIKYELAVRPEQYKPYQTKKGVWKKKDPPFTQFNYRSNYHLKYLLYEVFKLEVLKRQLVKHGKVTTNKETLEYLLTDSQVLVNFGRDHVAFLKTLMMVKNVTKQLTTIKTLLNAVDSNGRIHSTFNTTRVSTGRLSSSNPNLQNVDKKKKSLIRHCFVVPKGYRYVEADLSQAELRVLAFFSQDPWFIQVFEDDKDLHNEMSILLFGPQEHFDKKTWDEYRRISKTVNFGIPYGRTAFGITRALDFLSVSQAEQIIRDWFARCPEAGAYLLSQREKAARGEPIITPFGRERIFPLITDENRDGIQREASNNNIQSFASDLNLIAAMESYPEVNELDATYVNLVHDSQLLEVPDDDDIAYEIARIVHQNMVEVPERWAKCNVPFKADVKMGYSWETLKEISTSSIYTQAGLVEK